MSEVAITIQNSKVFDIAWTKKEKTKKFIKYGVAEEVEENISSNQIIKIEAKFGSNPSSVKMSLSIDSGRRMKFPELLEFIFQ